jgi:hypothetical protein
MFRVYHGTPGSGRLHPLQKGRWPCKEFGHLDEAFLWAKYAAKRGTSVLAIDGDDGTQLSRADIAAWLRGSR